MEHFAVIWSSANCDGVKHLSRLFFVYAGVTTNRPDELEFANTMTEIDHGTWMLSGSAVMKDGVILNNIYECDLDTLTTGSRIGQSCPCIFSPYRVLDQFLSR